ncbi:hypothetical protein [Bacillus cereus group sp. BfR-BA-01523]|uniref:hypothetical protein n=1 Tax=Bacillus cereus group sp. BfR-BA-01523 TaxID=2920371 RepID=UPI001F5861B6|nr:hypothetical protein [Bacillus cereus group sp. BfR-BA-01523]
MHKYRVTFYTDIVVGDDQPHYEVEMEAKDVNVIKKIIKSMLEKEFFEIESKHAELILLAKKNISEVIVKIKEEK